MSTLLQRAPRGSRNWPSPHATPHTRPRAVRRALPKAAPPGKGRPQSDSAALAQGRSLEGTSAISGG
jgi:hypothetical protein